MSPVFVYVITSYTEPSQTVRLLRRLRHDSPGARLIVSHDRKAPAPEAAALEGVGAELLLTPEPVTWGDATYLRSVLRAIEHAALDADDWLTVLTGQDYPIRPLSEYESFLADSPADMVLEEPDDDPHLDALLARYRVRSYRLPHWTDRHRIRQVVGRLPGLTLGREPRGLPPYLHRRRLRTPFGDDLVLRKGSDLFALSGRAAQALRSAPPGLMRYYAHTRVPSESYVHTVLRNQSSLRNHPTMLHYTRWGASPHPEWLGVDDLAAMRASAYWFARKFRPDDPALDRLDDLLD